jgi:hypothetical protein
VARARRVNVGECPTVQERPSGLVGPSRFGCRVPLRPWLPLACTPHHGHGREQNTHVGVGSTPAPGPSRHQTQATQPTSYQLAIRSSDRHDSRVIASALLAALHAHVTFVNGVAASSVGEKTSNLAGQRQRQHVPAYRSSCMHGPWGARF